MALSKEQRSARKAVRTRQARQQLKDKYGQVTYEVVRALETQTPVWSDAHVAAIKANYTRGTYDHLLKNCNF